MAQNPLAFALTVISHVAITFTLLGPALATETWMDAADLRTTFAGKQITGHYASGRTFDENYHHDGRLEYREPGQVRTGQWSITVGTFCTIYIGDPTGGCYRVTRISSNCFEFYFTARTEHEAQSGTHRKPGWTARAWLTGQPSTCNPDASV